MIRSWVSGLSSMRDLRRRIGKVVVTWLAGSGQCAVATGELSNVRSARLVEHESQKDGEGGIGRHGGSGAGLFVTVVERT